MGIEDKGIITAASEENQSGAKRSKIRDFARTPQPPHAEHGPDP